MKRIRKSIMAFLLVVTLSLGLVGIMPANTVLASTSYDSIYGPTPPSASWPFYWKFTGDYSKSYFNTFDSKETVSITATGDAKGEFSYMGQKFSIGIGVTVKLGLERTRYDYWYSYTKHYSLVNETNGYVADHFTSYYKIWQGHNYTAWTITSSVPA